MRVEKQIVLLQWYYKYLYLGGFLNQVIKDNDLSKYAVDLPIDTGNGMVFTLKGSTIKKNLADIFKYSDKKNFFGYITEISALKWVFGVMREMIESDEDFSNFLRKKLWKQYFPFDQITRFCRNVLVHAMDPDISLIVENFEWQTKYLREQKKHKIVFSFKYADFLEVWKWSKDYGVYIEIDFNHMKTGQKFFSVVKLHDLYLLAELCFNLTEVFRFHNKKNI